MLQYNISFASANSFARRPRNTAGLANTRDRRDRLRIYPYLHALNVFLLLKKYLSPGLPAEVFRSSVAIQGEKMDSGHLSFARSCIQPAIVRIPATVNLPFALAAAILSGAEAADLPIPSGEDMVSGTPPTDVAPPLADGEN